MNVSVVGHSHGGGLAQIVVLTGGIPTTCFNNRYPSRVIKENLIGKETCEKNQNCITNYHKAGDFLTGTRAVNKLAELFGVTTFLGTTYILPAKEKSAIAIHNETKWVDP